MRGCFYSVALHLEQPPSKTHRSTILPARLSYTNTNTNYTATGSQQHFTCIVRLGEEKKMFFFFFGLGSLLTGMVVECFGVQVLD